MFLKINFTTPYAPHFYISTMILEINKTQAFRAIFGISFSLATYILSLAQLQQLPLHNYIGFLFIVTALM